MSRKLSCACAMLWAANLLAAAAGQELSGWGKIADPEKDCQFNAAGGKLTIAVPGTPHDFTPLPGYKNNGPRVYQEIEGDFTVEVKVGGNIAPMKGTELPGKNIVFRAATLLIWLDAENFVRLDRGGLYKNGKTVATAYFHVFKDGKRIVELAPLIKEEPAYLRIERKGNTITASVRQGTAKRTFPSQKTTLPAKVQVALGAINASTQPLQAEFSEFSIKAKK